MGSITPINKAKTAGSLTSLPVLAESYRLSLEAQNKSPRTIQTYLEAIARLDAFLVTNGLPHDVRLIERSHIEAFIVDLLVTQSPATASNRYRALQSFFRWAEEVAGGSASTPRPRARVLGVADGMHTCSIEGQRIPPPSLYPAGPLPEVVVTITIV